MIVQVFTTSVSASDNLVCEGTEVTISANPLGGTPNFTYVWTPTGSGSSFTTVVNETTEFSVQVIDAEGCIAAGSVKVEVKDCSDPCDLDFWFGE